MNIRPGVKYILLATIFFALMNIGVKYLSRIPAYEIVFFRALVTLIVGYFLLRRGRISPWGNNKRDLILRGVTGTIALLIYFYTLQKMPLVSAVTIQYLSPIFTIIISGFMLGERPRSIQWFFFLFAFAGVVMVKGFDARISLIELSLGVTAAVFSALAYNYIRRLKDSDHPLVVVFYFPLVTVPVVGVYTLTHWVGPEPVEILILLLIGLSVTAAQIYLTKAYHADRASNISIYNYLGMLYAIAIGFLMFGETIPPLGYGGMALILLGVLLSGRFGRQS